MSEAIYRRYAIVDGAMLREGAEKLARAEQGKVGRGERPARTHDLLITNRLRTKLSRPKTIYSRENPSRRSKRWCSWALSVRGGMVAAR
ncbi:MAG: hypothetical protein ACE5JN_09690 [Candidatus Methylomirabilia bacterium]